LKSHHRGIEPQRDSRDENESEDGNVSDSCAAQFKELRSRSWFSLCLCASVVNRFLMLRVERKDYEALRRHGEDTYPHECCGVLLGHTDDEGSRVVTSTARCGNTRTDSPQNRYHIDPRELIRIQREGRERGEDVLGFYHSHPDHPARWSPTDLAEAHWIGSSYVITSVEKGKAVVTNSFELTGFDEADKHFVDEKIDIN
jgi:proteasome lid subunit RPN8/RPN11